MSLIRKALQDLFAGFTKTGGAPVKIYRFKYKEPTSRGVETEFQYFTVSASDAKKANDLAWKKFQEMKAEQKTSATYFTSA